MKKLILISSVIMFAFMTAFVINGNFVSTDNSNTPLPTFQVIVYQTNGSTVQAGARVKVYDSNNNQLETQLTNGSGIVSWAWSHGYVDYTVKTWYPDLPNDGQNAQRTVTYSGASIYTTLNLGPNY